MQNESFIKVFKPENDENEFYNWFNSLSARVRVKIRLMLTNMMRMKCYSEWKRPFFDKLTGYKKLHEIIINFEGMAYRLFGTFGPERGEFTILIGSIKKNSHYEPNDAINKANKRIDYINEEGAVDDFI